MIPENVWWLALAAFVILFIYGSWRQARHDRRKSKKSENGDDTYATTISYTNLGYGGEGISKKSSGNTAVGSSDGGDYGGGDGGGGGGGD
jgi:hypothetical protein